MQLLPTAGSLSIITIPKQFKKKKSWKQMKKYEGTLKPHAS